MEEILRTWTYQHSMIAAIAVAAVVLLLMMLFGKTPQYDESLFNPAGDPVEGRDRTILDEWREDLRSEMGIEEFLEKWYPFRADLQRIREQEKQKRESNDLRGMCGGKLRLLKHLPKENVFETEHVCCYGDIRRFKMAEKILMNDEVVCMWCDKTWPTKEVANEVARLFKS